MKDLGREAKKQKPHTHVIWDDMNMELKGGWNNKGRR